MWANADPGGSQLCFLNSGGILCSFEITGLWRPQKPEVMIFYNVKSDFQMTAINADFTSQCGPSEQGCAWGLAWASGVTPGSGAHAAFHTAVLQAFPQTHSLISV